MTYSINLALNSRIHERYSCIKFGVWSILYAGFLQMSESKIKKEISRLSVAIYPMILR